jgi:MFS family permease
MKLTVEKGSRLTVPQQVVLSVLWFAENFETAALLPLIIPAQVVLYVAPGTVGSGQQAGFLAILGAAGSLVALLAQPLSGFFSDRSRTPLGRRRPYVLAGTAIALAGAAAAGFGQQLALFMGGFVLLQLGTNVLLGGYQGMLPDLVPQDQRGSASGYLGFMTIVGNVASFGLAAVLLGSVNRGHANGALIREGALWFYLATGVALALATAITVIGVREPRLALRTSVSSDERRGWWHWLNPWLAPWRHHNFRWVWLTRASVFLGITLFLTFIEYYFAAVAHQSSFIGSTAILIVLALGAAVVSALVVGAISDRVGRVRPVAVTTAAMALAALVFVVAPAGIPLWPLGLLFGLGYGAYSSVDWALAVDALPQLQAAGRDMGVWSIASTLPMVLAPLLGGLVIATFSARHATPLGYRAVFALATILMLFGAAFVLRIREPRVRATACAPGRRFAPGRATSPPPPAERERRRQS